jgi:hypothetical protein
MIPQTSQVTKINQETSTLVGSRNVDVSRLLGDNSIGHAARPQGKGKKNKQRNGEGGQPQQQQPQQPKADSRPAQAPKPALPQRAALLAPPVSPSASKYLSRIAAPVKPEDGVDHINMTASGKTELGKFMDVNTLAVFSFAHLGEFSSVGAVWCFLYTPELVRNERADEIRNRHGSRARGAAAEAARQYYPPNGFRVMIAEATWAKVLAHPKYAKQLAELDLPIRMYQIGGEEGPDQMVPLKHSPWYIDAISEIQAVLHAREKNGDPDLMPNFDFLETTVYKNVSDTGYAGNFSNKGGSGYKGNSNGAPRNSQRR